MLTGSFDSTLIDQIVGEVLAQLRQRVGSAGSTGGNGQPPTRSKSQPFKGIELADAVITAETLEKTAKRGEVVRISPTAIMTPSARDYIREHKVQLVQVRNNPTSERVASSQRGIIVASHLPGVVQTFLNEVKTQYASTWNVEVESGNPNIIERTRSIICRGESPQVLVLVKQPHRAACFVNRNSQCRAAVVRRGSDVQMVRAEIGANVICVDLEQPIYMELRRIFRAVSETQSQIQKPSEG